MAALDFGELDREQRRTSLDVDPAAIALGRVARHIEAVDRLDLPRTAVDRLGIPGRNRWRRGGLVARPVDAVFEITVIVEEIVDDHIDRLLRLVPVAPLVTRLVAAADRFGAEQMLARRG